MDGILIVDKPTGITSYDVIRFLKRKFGVLDRIGHAGTLDPIATGVLIVCLGKATKVSARLMGMDKEYVARMACGVVTDTGDSDGKILEQRDGTVNPAIIPGVLREFVGEIRQVPPVVSALKHKGAPLYKLYRSGVTVTPEPRTVVVKEIELLAADPPEIGLRIVCSRGTYVRALCRDIGERFGCGGTMTALQRTRVGPFTVAAAHAEQEMVSRGLDGLLIPLATVERMITDWNST